MRTLLQNPFSLVLPALLSFAIMDGTAQNFDWEFKDANQTEGWTLAGAISNGISNGVWKLTATQGNPRIFTPKLQIDAGRWKTVTFRMRLGNGVQTNGHLQFITEKHPQWDNQTLTPFTCQPDGKWHNYVVDMSDNPLWNGKITQLLFQPFALPWRPPQGQRIVELERFELINMELETGLYGFQDKPTSASPMAVSIDSRNRLSARYIRIESRIDLEFVELEAYNANKTNVALKKPVRVSTPIWGDGSPGNDGNITDGGHSPIVQMRVMSLLILWFSVRNLVGGPPFPFHGGSSHETAALTRRCVLSQPRLRPFRSGGRASVGTPRLLWSPAHRSLPVPHLWQDLYGDEGDLFLSVAYGTGEDTECFGDGRRTRGHSGDEPGHRC